MFSRKAILTVAASVSAFTLATPASAVVIFDSIVTSTGGSFHLGPYPYPFATVAVPFIPSTDVTLTRLAIVGQAYYSPDVILQVFAGGASSPTGSALWTFSLVDMPSLPLPELGINLDPADTVSLSAGNQYWLQMTVADGTYQWSQSTGTSVTAYSCATTTGAGCSTAYTVPQLSIEGTELATGAVPEPATWAMMVIGFAAVGSAMRRSPARLRLS